MSIEPPGPGLHEIRKQYPLLLRKLFALKGPQWLSEIVLPVIVLEDESEAIQQAALGRGWFTEGILTAAPAGTVHADTGTIADLGTYAAAVVLYSSGAGNRWRIALRNALNTADVVFQDTFTASDSQPAQLVDLIFTVQNVAERFRVTNPNILGAGVLSQASIFLRRVS